MTTPRSSPRSVLPAMFTAGAIAAQFVGGKATRDALFLAHQDVTTLPMMVIATSVFSIVLVAANSKSAGRIAPATLVPASFATSGVLFLAEWLLTYRAPSNAAVLVYLHISGFGPLLASGFWLISSERFDPRTAKKRFGQIAGAGTLGGVLGGTLAGSVGPALGVATMLPFLAVINLICAWQVRRLATPLARWTATSMDAPPELVPAPVRSGLRVLGEAPYLCHLAALVLLGTTSVALLDYLFKVEAVRTFGRGEGLVRFFAIYYSATSLITFVVQTSSSRFALERFGLALTTSTPSLAMLAGSLAGLVVPGFGSLLGTRAGESIFRGSLFRAGYELFYTPIPASEKRAAKSIIDVGFDRLGDAVGGGVVRLVLLLAPAAQYSTLLSLCIACAAAAIVVASRLNRGYIQTLEKSLLNRAVELDLSEVEDVTTRTAMLRTLQQPWSDLERSGADRLERPTRQSTSVGIADAEIQEIVRLRSYDREQIVKILRREEGLSAALVPHVVPLLAWGPVANDAIFALRKVAEERIGELVDALIDPNQDFAVRRRLARVFSVCVSQRAADGLMLGLDDLRFEVRFQCGRSLAAILEKNPRVRIDREHVFAVVLREAAVGRPVWEGRRLLDGLEMRDAVSFVDELVRDRAGQSLAHVFTLLSLVLPREPLQIAFRGLHTEDQGLQGTALEYLDGVLPAAIRDRLWPFLEDRRPAGRPSSRPRDEILADLLRSNQSIMMNLEELKRRAGAGQSSEPTKLKGAPKPVTP